ncbi:putative SWI/SNF-related matrix-associated actin-dependent regulator of chromatin subfamily A member 3-like 2 isoform X2 [Solanum tuberosum]|uniref:putative SWI/SNF-related matrix-associated actin-dependent regulator of chromatin subfamily A member 3-like 2 isoform X2 n=1 Tax=Solanum tuberosum TaxID=4113 RepID=UPI0003D27375|nr:PREDICTED: putative SWI/SNF-related matrix-associated actin-dependent regulator of chromatin subfamily A member 3-like 2 isoform X2 [Solanum tuberosum]
MAGIKVTEELVSMVRSIVGDEYTQMDIIRSLHMAKNDPTAAINIIFDTPSFKKIEIRNTHLNSEAGNVSSNSGKIKEAEISTVSSNEGLDTESEFGDNGLVGKRAGCDMGSECGSNGLVGKRAGCDLGSECGSNGLVGKRAGCDMGSEWWYVGCGEVAGMSTCKGRILKPGDEVDFTFPVEKKLSSPSPGKFGGGRGRQAAACSEIVRFSTKACGEIGRIPNEWARCILPLVRDKKIRIEGCCKSAPNILGIMDSVLLSVRVHINSSMFRKSHQTSLKARSNPADDTVVHPLPTLFHLLGLTPFKKAEFTPADLYMRKRPLNEQDSSGGPASLLRANLSKSSSSADGDKVEDDESISDTDLDCIVGLADSSKLQEMEPPTTLQCELRPYQKQALHWMTQLERGRNTDEAATTLHPCWNAYRLKDKRELVVYLNAFSGDATTEFPSTLEMARGGILADSMGLGKTIMTISLLLSHSERGGSSGSQSTSQLSSENGEASNILGHSPTFAKKSAKFSSLDKLLKHKPILISGGNLIICPMTLLGQWKAEIEAHAQPGALSVYVYYGQTRSKDAKVLARSDVVLTTYGVLASEFSAENAEDSGGLLSIRWFRVVLDEAHTIKSSKSQISNAAAALIADRRWCLTGTPIQNNLEDIYSLLRFLRVEPWGSWAWWNKLIQKPFEEGDERGLKLVQSILSLIMLRRTKSSTDREGRPILVLPPADIQVIYCELTEAERDFYDALYKRSKVKFDQFVEQGRVLHNYASILELLLRLRQCCDHPFLVMSRGDTQEFSDLNKLAKRFLKGGKETGEGKDVPSRAYIQEVVEELRNGEQGECPICLEAFEDAVLTPCAHRLCRECLLASWRSSNSGLCPVCRNTVSRQELITAPSDNRFQVDVEKNWVESSKVSALLFELKRLHSVGSKSIVFSQWTAFLDLLQIPLSCSIPFVRLDGTLNQQQREKVIKKFSEEDDISVLLMSLKAGGVGINLTAASNAFVMDPWWNPAVEEQAVMRVHRIGQTKQVMIKRFIVKGSVEERMEAVQARKQRMISGALTDQEVRTARIEELKMLFA